MSDRPLTDEYFTRAGNEVALDLIRKVLREHGSAPAMHFGFGMLLAVIRVMWGSAKAPKRAKVQTNIDRAIDWAEKVEAIDPIVETAEEVPGKPPGGMLH